MLVALRKNLDTPTTKITETVYRFIKTKPKSFVAAQWKYVAIYFCWICSSYKKSIREYEAAFTVEKGTKEDGAHQC